MPIDVTLTKLCRMANRYSKSTTAFRSSSGEGVFVIQLLEQLSIELSRETNIRKYSNIKITYSRGQSNIPKIFWIGAVPTSRTVSTSISVTICFGRNGEGIVVGLMVPKAGVFHELSTVLRSTGLMSVNVDGDKNGARYNDCFINPKEWLATDIDPEEIISHFNDSLQMLSDLSANGNNGYSAIQPGSQG